MAAKIKEFYEDNQLLVIGVLFLVIAIIFSWLLRTNHRASNNVDSTIQQAKTDNQRTGEQIKSASGQIGEAQGNISRAVERTERIENIVKENAGTIGECEQLVRDCQDLNREAKSIINNVELANSKGTSGKAERAKPK